MASWSLKVADENGKIREPDPDSDPLAEARNPGSGSVGTKMSQIRNTAQMIQLPIRRFALPMDLEYLNKTTRFAGVDSAPPPLAS